MTKKSLLVLTASEFLPDQPNLDCEVYFGDRLEIEAMYQEAISAEDATYSAYLIADVTNMMQMQLIPIIKQEQEC